ncbi:hypothetical protein ACQKIW_31585 [Bacillus thuringiensis]|uniref:hypothetical protein n=1 Tax=Bacillus thuringiensis TaxID=1428 RepID=UPI003D0318AC
MKKISFKIVAIPMLAVTVLATGSAPTYSFAAETYVQEKKATARVNEITDLQALIGKLNANATTLMSPGWNLQMVMDVEQMANLNIQRHYYDLRNTMEQAKKDIALGGLGGLMNDSVIATLQVAKKDIQLGGAATTAYLKGERIPVIAGGGTIPPVKSSDFAKIVLPLLENWVNTAKEYTGKAFTTAGKVRGNLEVQARWIGPAADQIQRTLTNGTHTLHQRDELSQVHAPLANMYDAIAGVSGSTDIIDHLQSQLADLQGILKDIHNHVKQDGSIDPDFLQPELETVSQLFEESTQKLSQLGI